MRAAWRGRDAQWKKNAEGCAPGLQPVRESNVRIARRIIPRIPRHQQGSIEARRSPDNRVWQFQPMQLAERNGFPRHAFVEFDNWKSAKEILTNRPLIG